MICLFTHLFASANTHTSRNGLNRPLLVIRRPTINPALQRKTDRLFPIYSQWEPLRCRRWPQAQQTSSLRCFWLDSVAVGRPCAVIFYIGTPGLPLVQSKCSVRTKRVTVNTRRKPLKHLKSAHEYMQDSQVCWESSADTNAVWSGNTHTHTHIVSLPTKVIMCSNNERKDSILSLERDTGYVMVLGHFRHWKPSSDCLVWSIGAMRKIISQRNSTAFLAVTLCLYLWLLLIPLWAR